MVPKIWLRGRSGNQKDAASGRNRAVDDGKPVGVGHWKAGDTSVFFRQIQCLRYRRRVCGQILLGQAHEFR